MRTRRTPTLLCLVALLAAAVPAAAQELPPITDEPPVDLSPNEPATPKKESGEAKRQSTAGPPTPALPATGADPALVALLGFGMLGTGLGVRLRLR